MPRSRRRSPHGTPGRGLVLAIAALLLCILSLTGCTQPVIPAPAPAQTTLPPVTMTRTQAIPPATTAPVTTKRPDYLTYTNTQYGFSMSYPAGWSIQEGKGGSVVTFSSPSSGMGDTPATVKISVEDLSGNPMSLDQFKAAQLAKKQGLDKFNIIYDLAYKGPGFNGWKIGYTYDAGTLMKTFEVYILRGGQAYSIDYSSKEDRFAGYSVQMDNMLKSFQLTG
jgi:hypothetical protein